MKTNFVLADFENMQPKSIDVPRVGPFKSQVFLGANQIPIVEGKLSYGSAS